VLVLVLVLGVVTTRAGVFVAVVVLTCTVRGGAAVVGRAAAGGLRTGGGVTGMMMSGVGIHSPIGRTAQPRG